MKPRGSINGYVVKNEKGAMQAGMYRDPDTKVQIQVIKLEGSGISRTLIPMEDHDIDYSEHYLSGMDHAANGGFYFYGLS